MIIRRESRVDAAAISAVTVAAFRDHLHSDQTEHLIIDRLRQSGALTISLVAEVDGRLIGHVAFSPVAVSDGSPDWFGLGPLSVHPDVQRRGIGSALVLQGIETLRERNAAGCVVMGDPDFYVKFGFRHDTQMMLADCAPQYFLTQPLSSTRGSGMVTYNAAFYAGLNG